MRPSLIRQAVEIRRTYKSMESNQDSTLSKEREAYFNYRVFPHGFREPGQLGLENLLAFVAAQVKLRPGPPPRPS